MHPEVVQAVRFSLHVLLTLCLQIVEVICTHLLDQSDELIIKTVEHFLLSLIVIGNSSGLQLSVFVLK